MQGVANLLRAPAAHPVRGPLLTVLARCFGGYDLGCRVLQCRASPICSAYGARLAAICACTLG